MSVIQIKNGSSLSFIFIFSAGLDQPLLKNT